MNTIKEKTKHQGASHIKEGSIASSVLHRKAMTPPACPLLKEGGDYEVKLRINF